MQRCFLYFGTNFKRQWRQWKEDKPLALKSSTAVSTIINNGSIWDWVYFVYLNFVDLLCLRHNGKFVVVLYLSFDRIFCQVLPSCCKKLSSTWKDEMNCVTSPITIGRLGFRFPRKRHFRLSGTPKVNFCLSRGTHIYFVGPIRVLQNRHPLRNGIENS